MKQNQKTGTSLSCMTMGLCCIMGLCLVFAAASGQGESEAEQQDRQ